MTTPEYLRTLAAFLADTTCASLPAHVRAHGRLLLADTVAATGAGMRVPEMRRFVDAHLLDAGSGPAWVIGAGRRARASDAAFLNGTAATWLELNEGNLRARGHPSVQVIPAALATAQAIDASGADLLAAILLGYEACARLAAAANVRLAIHPHGTWGVIGAAVAVGKLHGFDARQFAELINCAATLGLATSRTTLLEGATVRNPFTGHSGQMGIAAVRMVASGFTGQHDAPGAIFTQVLSDRFTPEQAVDGLGREWLATLGYFKLHPTGRYVHAALDAFDDALQRAGHASLAPDDIRSIHVRAYLLAAMLAGQDVDSSFGARFSIPFALATRIVHGHTRLAAFDEAAVADPAVRALARKVHVVEDPAHTAAYPATQRCDLAIHLAGGRVLEGHCEVMRGEPEHPHPPAALRAKFFDLAVPLWGEATAAALYAGLMAVDDIPRFGAFGATFAL